MSTSINDVTVTIRRIQELPLSSWHEIVMLEPHLILKNMDNEKLLVKCEQMRLSLIEVGAIAKHGCVKVNRTAGLDSRTMDRYNVSLFQWQYPPSVTFTIVFSLVKHG